MMTDRDLAAALLQVKDGEASARQYWAQCQRRQDLSEADQALNVIRQFVGVRKALELWILTRAERGARQVVK